MDARSRKFNLFSLVIFACYTNLLSTRLEAHFNLPKLHAAEHFLRSIRRFGTTDNYNTESTERLHIDLAKDAYDATNGKEYIQQMIHWLERRDRDQFADGDLWRPVRRQLAPARRDPGAVREHTAFRHTYAE